MLSVILQKQIKSTVNIFVQGARQDLLYKMTGTFADFPANSISCQRWMKKCIPDMIDGIGQIFQGVDQGAVKVKENSPDDHSGFFFWGASALGRMITGVFAAR